MGTPLIPMPPYGTAMTPPQYQIGDAGGGGLSVGHVPRQHCLGGGRQEDQD